jgi:SAM-dependent methyltransferase
VVVHGRASRDAPPVSSLADAYSAAAPAWASGPDRIYGRMAEVVIAQSPVAVQGRTVLDVGTGTGAVARVVEASGAAAVIAVDTAFGMIAHNACDRPPGVVGDAVALPFANRSFDVVIAAFSLNHLREPEKGLVEMARLTDRGGAIIASSYAADDGHPVKASVERALAGAGWRAPAWYLDVREAAVPRLSTADGWRRALDAADLEGEVRSIRVPFESVSPRALVDWRLGMAQHAPFFRSLPPAARERVVAAAIDDLGDDVEPLVRSILVVSVLNR